MHWQTVAEIVVATAGPGVCHWRCRVEHCRDTASGAPACQGQGIWGSRFFAIASRQLAELLASTGQVRLVILQGSLPSRRREWTLKKTKLKDGYRYR